MYTVKRLAYVLVGAMILFGPGFGLAAERHVTTSAELAAALGAPGTPGEIICIRGGTYKGSFTSKLAGTAEKPILVRQHPGERVTLDGAGGKPGSFVLAVQGPWVAFADFEVTNSDPNRWGGPGRRAYGVEVGVPHVRLLNLVVHDTAQGFSLWEGGIDTEVYGCLVYNNGTDNSDRPHGHGIYMQNNAGTKRIVDNVIFHHYQYGIHGYGQQGHVRGFHIEGNAFFNNGVASKGAGELKDNCLIGTRLGSERILLQENFGWSRSVETRSVGLGKYSGANKDVTLKDNYLVGETKFFAWQSITLTGNTFYGAVPGASGGSNNHYLTARPSENKVFVRPNRHQAGRAHIVVYNWRMADSVTVDLGAVLAPGARYEIRNAQNYFADPVASGTLSGTTVSLPVSGLEPAQPIGSPGAIQPGERTGKEFNVFVLCGSEGSSLEPVARRPAPVVAAAAAAGDAFSDPILPTEAKAGTAIGTVIAVQEKAERSGHLIAVTVRISAAEKKVFCASDREAGLFAKAQKAAVGDILMLGYRSDDRCRWVKSLEKMGSVASGK